MIEHAIVGAVIGAALGLRLNAIVLFPAMGVVSALMFVLGLATGCAGWSIALTTIITAVFLQFGFIGMAAAVEVTPARKTSREKQIKSSRQHRVPFAFFS
jgi:hypothetical protein